MATLVILKGLPLSGKTKWARKWASQKQKRIRVSWTEMLDVMGRGPSRLMRPLAVDAACRLMSQALRQGCDVVLDECNLYPPEFAPFLLRANLLKAKVTFQTMEADIEDVKRRNAELGHPVRDMELDRLAEHYAMWLKHR